MHIKKHLAKLFFFFFGHWILLHLGWVYSKPSNLSYSLLALCQFLPKVKASFSDRHSR